MNVTNKTVMQQHCSFFWTAQPITIAFYGLLPKDSRIELKICILNPPKVRQLDVFTRAGLKNQHN